MNELVDEIIEKFDNYMEKKGLSTQEKHNITRLMSEEYWDDIKNEGDTPDPDDSDLDDVLDEADDQEEEPVQIKGGYQNDRIKVVNKKVIIKDKPQKPTINKPTEEFDDF